MNHPVALHPKTAAAGLSSALALIILWGVSYGIKVPPEVAAAFTAVLGFFGAWLAPWIPQAPPAK